MARRDRTRNTKPKRGEPFSSEERDAWAPLPTGIKLSAFAARYRILSELESAEPGRWTNERTPYLTEIMDAIGDPTIRSVAIKKPAQVGGTNCWMNALLYWILLDPGPVMAVFPDMISAFEAMDERVMPMLKACIPEMDFRKSGGKNAGCSIHAPGIRINFVWGSSAARLASKPIRYLIMDELNKFPTWTGNDADPRALATARLKTWKSRSKRIVLSTPTTPDGPITEEFDLCADRRVAELRCAGCDGYFEPSLKLVGAPDEMKVTASGVERIEKDQLAWLQCPMCGYQMDERERYSVLSDVQWKREGVEASLDVGFRFHSLVTPWVSMSGLLAKFLRNHKHPAKLMEIITQDFGEDFEPRQFTVAKGVIQDRLHEAMDGRYLRAVIPSWAGALVAGVDTQKDGYYWAVRAFGRGFQSRLIDCGYAVTLEDIERVVLNRPFRHEVAGEMRISALAIDARGATAAGYRDGNKTDEIFRWSLTDERIYPVLGATVSAPRAPVQALRGQYAPSLGKGRKGASYYVQRWIVDVNYFKDILSARMHDPGIWQLYEETPDDYVKQMDSEHKVVVRGPKTRASMGGLETIWKLKSGRTANHYWDVETYITAIAHHLRLDLCPKEEDLERILKAQLERKGIDPTRGPALPGRGTFIDPSADRTVYEDPDDVRGWIRRRK